MQDMYRFQPFWPTGSGCARGFLGGFDAAWMMRGWGLGQEPLDLLAERDSIYRLLAQTTPENISKNFDEYSINPVTRYPNLNKSCVSHNRVKQLFDNRDGPIDQADGQEEPMDIGKDLGKIEEGGERLHALQTQGMVGLYRYCRQVRWKEMVGLIL